MNDANENLSREEKILKTAISRFSMCMEAEESIRTEALKDLQFRKGDHWPSDIKNTRAQDSRPCLTINKMPQFVRQITNDQKQNRPAIEVNPYDDYADVDTAEILQGIIRNIENVSDADYAYDKAFEGAATASFGYFRLITQYVDEKSFDQELRIEMLDNPFKVCLDPYSIKPDGSDAKFGFIWDSMTRDEFKAEYGESKLARHMDWNALEKHYKGWVGPDEVRVAEYFYKDVEKIKVYQLSNGETYFADDLPDQNEDGSYTIKFQVVDPTTSDVLSDEDTYTVENERWSQKVVVKWIKMNSIEILEETDWAGSYIPIIPVYGDVLNIDGEIVRESVIRHARDPQRILNFWASSEAEAITLAPKAPFIGAEGQFKGHENTWKQANVKNYPYLEYRPVSHEGQLMPPPQRNSFEPPVMAITNARLQANEDIKATTGIYDASLGSRSNEVSGIAIQRRNRQSQISNFHLVDNLSKSIRHCGRQMVEIIPRIYDQKRVIRIIGLDGTKKMVRINSDEDMMKDQKRAYHFSYGKYDVAVSTGPNYETKRQEARDAMLEMSSKNAKFAEVASDLVVRNMDFPGSQEMADRLKRTMPPNIIGDEDKEIPQQAQALMAQMTEQIENLNQELMQTKEILDKDILKIQSDERIALMKSETEIKKEVLKLHGVDSGIMLNRELESIDQRMDQLGGDSPVGDVIGDETEEAEMFEPIGTSHI